MPDDTLVFCDEPQRDEETVEVTGSILLPPPEELQPPVLTEFDWLDRTESNILLHAIEIKPRASKAPESR